MYHHRIPCYGDLTPGIPDVVDSKAADHLLLLLQNDVHTRPGDQKLLERKEMSPDLLDSCSYACLRLHTTTGDLKAVLAVARDFSPRVMAASEREVLVDISGLGRLIGPPDEIARQLARALFDAGLVAGVAIGRTQTIARLLAHAAARGERCEARGGDGIFEPVAAEGRDRASRLASLASPVGPWLQLPVQLLQELEAGLKACATAGMNERDRLRPYETLERWGIVTLGDLAALPASDLSSRLGRRGVALQKLARGLDLRPFVPDPETVRFTERLELEWPIESLEPLSFVLARLLDPLSFALERADRGAVAVRLELRLTDRSTFTRVLPLPAPMRDARVLRTLLLLALESRSPPAAIDVVSIELDPAPARIVRYSLLERALPSPETLTTLTARLSALVGESRVGSAVLQDTHRADRVAMTRYAPSAEGASGAQDGAGGAGDAWVLRRQRVPPAIRVRVVHGRPVYLAAPKRGMPQGAVVQAAGPWRTSGGWWCEGGWNSACGSSEAAERSPAKPDRRASASGAPRAWDRDEWDVELSSCVVCRIYRDRTTEQWFFEGTYD